MREYTRPKLALIKKCYYTELKNEFKFKLTVSLKNVVGTNLAVNLHLRL